MRMPYDCRACGMREWIWNSRDGVTPFIVGCQACRGEAQHTDWRLDQYLPNYVPKPHERVFVNFTPEAALEVATRMVARSDGTPYELAGAVREWVIADEAARWVRDGEPDLIEVGPEGWKPQRPHLTLVERKVLEGGA